jgi:hypothetical protein
MDKVYHIYAKDRCIIHNVSEEDFDTVWRTLNTLVEFLNTEYKSEDLSYLECLSSRDNTINASYWQEINKTLEFDLRLIIHSWQKDSQ